MSYDGAIFDLQWKSVKVDRPKVFAICDVSVPWPATPASC